MALAKWCVACHGCVQFVLALNSYHAVGMASGLNWHRFDVNECECLERTCMELTCFVFGDIKCPSSASLV